MKINELQTANVWVWYMVCEMEYERQIYIVSKWSKIKILMGAILA